MSKPTFKPKAALIASAACLSLAVLASALADRNAAPPAANKPGAAPSARDALATMSWLAGDWVGEMDGGRFDAYYSTPEGGRILSYSTLTKDGKVVFHEFEVFAVSKDTLRLRPHPRAMPAAIFTMQSIEPQRRRAVFQNPHNEFPKRIAYHRVSESRLLITLSDLGAEEGHQEQTFDLRRPAAKQKPPSKLRP